MTKVYIIIQGEGAYSDRIEEPVKVYRDKATAEQVFASLDTISRQVKRDDWQFPSTDNDKKLVERVKQQYTALGFEASWEHDWELAEAEFIE